MKYECWMEDGKYFHKEGLLSKKREISKAEFDKIISENAVHSIDITQNETMGIKEMLDLFLKHRKNKISEFGRRVIVTLADEKQTEPGENGIDIEFKLEVKSEDPNHNDDDLFSISSRLENVTGPLTEDGVYFPEVYRAVYTLAFNGWLATDEEQLAVKTAFKKRLNKSLD